MRTNENVQNLAKLRESIDLATETERLASNASGSSSLTRFVVLLSQIRVIAGSPLSSASTPYDIMIPSVGTGAGCLLHVESSALMLSVETLAQRITEEAREHLKVRSRTLRERTLGVGAGESADAGEGGFAEEVEEREEVDESD